MVDKRHQYIIDKVTTGLKIDPGVVNKFAGMEANKQLMEDFFKSGGPVVLLWFYNMKHYGGGTGGEDEEGENWEIRSAHSSSTMMSMAPTIVTGDTASTAGGPQSVHGAKEVQPLLAVSSNASQYSLKRGLLVYFIKKNKNENVTTTRVEDQIAFGVINGSNGILNELKTRLENIYVPSLKMETDWGELSKKGVDSTKEISEFIHQVDKFVNVLDESITAIKCTVRLAPPKKNFGIEAKSKSYQKASTRTEIVTMFEEKLKEWTKQIEGILSESSRTLSIGGDKPGEAAGPHSELEYWKQRMAKFNSITDQLRQRGCRIVLGVLKYARSPLLQDWKELDIRITDAANEAKDNVKYLYILEKYSQPLYRFEPVQMIASIPGLISGIQMMHSIARYYNTSERMTSLFVKITNQMMICCRKYITDAGSLWEQDITNLIEKFKHCIDLNESYQHCYRKTKAELARQPYGKQFDFSDAVIFGKFDEFCWRIQKLIDLFTTIHQFKLLESSKIENIGPITEQFETILQNIQAQPYDFLDHTNKSFDEDYIKFNYDITELEQELVSFINNCFGSASSTQHSLELLNQFRAVLKQDSLQRLLEEKHKIIFNNYGRDVENVKQIYERYKNNPPLSRTAPPVAGNIAWARQLLRKIEEPMKLFETTNVIRTKDARRIIKLYNKLAFALVQFDGLWYQRWLEAMQTARDGLHATLLVRHPESGRIHVNFDNTLMRLIREVQCLERMGYPIPDSARSVSNLENRLREYSEHLKFMLSEYYRVIESPHPVYKVLLAPMIKRVERALEPGLRNLTWLSMSIDSYVEKVFDLLEDLEVIIQKSTDLVEKRLETNCNSISHKNFLLFEDKIVTIESFVALQEKQVQVISNEINVKNQEIEAACGDLVELITSEYSPDENRSLAASVKAMRKGYMQKMFDSVVESLNRSVKVLHHRIMASSEDPDPVFSAQVTLFIPDIKLSPSLEQIQRCINKCARTILESTKNIYLWNSDVGLSEESIYAMVGENKDTINAFMQLTNAVGHLSAQIDKFLESFVKDHFLWKLNRGEEVLKFKSENADKDTAIAIENYRSRIRRYAELENELEAKAKLVNMGSLALDLSPISAALKTEATQWKHAFARALNEIGRTIMQEFVSFMEETENNLNRNIGDDDLEIVNLKMSTIQKMSVEESKIEATTSPIEQCYGILNQYNCPVARSEQDAVDNIDYQWSNLVKLTRETMSNLQVIGPSFRKKLLKDLKVFTKDVTEFKVSYDKNGPMRPGIKPREAMKALKKYENAYDERNRKWTTYRMGESLFGLPETKFPELEEIGNNLTFLRRLYDLYSNVIITVANFEQVTWAELDTEVMESKLSEFQTAYKRMPNALRGWDAYIELKQMIDDFYNTLPLLQALTEEYIRDRHWHEIEELVGVSLDYKNPEFKVKNFIDAKIVEYHEDVEEICNAASRQQDIEKKLNEIKLAWGPAGWNFQLGSFKNRGNLMLKDVADMMQEMEDAQLLLSGLVANIFNKPFKKEITLWLKKLTITQTVIDDWLKVQALWIYLEAVFTGGDIAKELPTVAKRFQNVDRSWVKIMTTVESEPNVVKMCYSNEMLRELLPHLKENLEKCQKSLSGYLEAKRLIFPRFFFLSDGQLLEILGQGSDPQSIQPHLLSIFANIKRVEFDEKNRKKIVKMISSEGEECDLKNGLECKGNVEDWLNNMVDEMRETIGYRVQLMSQKLVEDLNEADQDKFDKYIKRYLAQVSLLGLQVFWTYDSEVAIRNSKTERGIMQNTRKKFELLLAHLIDFTTVSTLNKRERRRIETMITIHIHQVEIFQHLCQKRVKNISSFEWLKQTRFYWRPEENRVQIRITDVDFQYCNEFLGTLGKLVITPLTDRIYISCAQAMGMFLGGAPAGPAGTGKTETTKDMGATMGKYFITVNCITGDARVQSHDGIGYTLSDLYNGHTDEADDEVTHEEIRPFRGALSVAGIVDEDADDVFNTKVSITGKHTARWSNNSGKSAQDVITEAYTHHSVRNDEENVVAIAQDNSQQDLAEYNILSSDVKNATRIIKRAGKSNCVKITLLDGTELKCTPEHRLLVVRNGETSYMTAGDIEQAIDTRNNVYERIQVVRGDAPVRKNIDEYRHTAVNVLTQNDVKALAQALDRDESSVKNSLYPIHFPLTSNQVEICKALFRMMGLVFANGQLSTKVHNNSRIYSGSVALGEFSDVEDLSRDVQTIIPGFQVQWQLKNNGSDYFSVVLPPTVCHLLAMLGCSVGTQNFAYPAVLLRDNVPVYFTREFVSAFLGGKGCAPTTDSEGHPTMAPFMLSSTKEAMPALAAFMNHLNNAFVKLGFTSMEVISKHNQSGLRINDEDITKLESNVRFAYSAEKRRKTRLVASFQHFENFMADQINAMRTRGLELNQKFGVAWKIGQFWPIKQRLLQEFPQHAWYLNETKNIHQQWAESTTFSSPYVNYMRWKQLVIMDSLDFIAVPVGTVESIGAQIVYDVTVPENTNFTANGVVVHNCSDQMNYKALGMLFKGISTSGIWCGFDEVNRIYVEVLSVVAAQIKCFFDAMKAHAKKFTFTDGTDLVLDDDCAIFVTMNPGYAGRTELPENMKRLFRTIAVVVPDKQIIMKVKLASSGFQENIPLSRKFYVLYRLCEEQLSKQIHYDFGLRNILSVLRTCGSVLRTDKSASETKVLMRVLRDMNVSKLVDEDSILFLELIKDLFPGEKVKDSHYEEFQKAITQICEKEGYTNHPDWNLKIIQIYEQYRVRHGVCVMGPSGGGKSSALKLLSESLNIIERKVKVKKMNPKAITASQMFGILDPATNDWTDGIFTALWRMAATRADQENSWILLDGPVDTLWIENLNTVLDDTKVFTLANGDRLMMPPSLKLIFEVGNLDNASPATVSRLGMVYVGLSALGWTPIFEAWKNKYMKANQFTNIMPKFDELFKAHIKILQEFVELDLGAVMDVHKVNYISSLLRILDGLLDTVKGKTLTSAWAERLFVFAVIWSIGALLESEDRVKFHHFLKKRKFDLPQIDNESEDTVFDYVTDANGNWEHWDVRVPDYKYPQKHTPQFSTIIVPTVDNVRTQFLISLIASQKLPVLLIGSSGTAKTVTIQRFIGSQDKKKYLDKFLSFSSATTPAIFQNTIFTAMEKRMGSQYGPPVGKTMMIFIDDINMPFINEWGDQITNEIVRELIEDGGFYSLENAGDWLTILDVQFFGAMNQPGGGRNDIPERMKRHFTIFNMTFPSNVSIDNIFGSICRGHFSAGRSFSPEVIKAAAHMAPMTRVLWDATRKKMLPTPKKFHYVFNLRDLSRVFQGMLTVTPEVVKKPLDLVMLWKHECERVLSDKFIEEADHGWFHDRILSIIADNFGESMREDNEETQYYVDFLREAEEAVADDTAEVEESVEPKVYEPVPHDNNMEKLSNRLQSLLGGFNEQYKRLRMNLVLFKFAMQHIMRISRIIRTDRGNALLVGVGGSGKQSLTRLASFIAGYETFKLQITKTYGINQLMEDLGSLYKIAVQQPVTFLFTDSDVKEEQFLEYLNMMLISGEIPGLFSKEDRDIIIEELRPIATKIPNFMATTDNMYKFMINRIRDNLHIVLCFSPVGDTFRGRARKFPGLVSGCNINWFPPWPIEALHATAAQFLSDFHIVHSGNQKEELVNFMCNIHEKIVLLTREYFEKFRRNTYVTPKSYLSFIENYKMIYTKKFAEISKMGDQLKKGLSKLEQAADDIEKMKVVLVEKEENLAIAVRRSDILLKEVTKQKAIAEKNAQAVEAQAEELSQNLAIIEKQKAEVENDLKKAEPALLQAEEALKKVKAQDLVIVKNLGTPPPLVKLVMDGVLIILGEKVNAVQMDKEFFEAKKTKGRKVPLASWDLAKKAMDTRFVNRIFDFDRDSITDEVCELLAPYLDQPDFTFESVASASQAVAGLAQWVRCMTEYHTIAKEVAPKKAAVREAEGQLRAAQAKLDSARAELAEKQKELDKMKAKVDEAMEKRKALEDDAKRTKDRMEAAEALIGGLSGERKRWKEDAKKFDDRIARLIGDVAITSTFLSYAGPFNQEFRERIVSKLVVEDLSERGIPMSDSVDVIKFLTTPTQLGEWSLQNLPNDSHSQQNAIVITQGTRFPLLIDPQGQGKNWIFHREKDLVVTTLSDKQFRNKLESCMGLGVPMIIEDIGEDLDPVLDPVLEKQLIRKGKRLKIKLGDDEVNYDERFQLYITTKLPNPNYTPEIYAKASIIDFTVTSIGLEDQLLGIVIVKEMNELEKKRIKLMNEIQSCKQIMADCEKELLDKLSNTEGDLLEDAELIGVLNQSQERAADMKIKLAGATDTEKEITEAREEFRSVATRGSVMYFVITELALINCMYQISLSEFIRLFIEAIDHAEKDRNLQKRIAHIIDQTTYEIYKYVQRGLYESDKRTYALLLAVKIDLRANRISQKEFKCLLQAGASLNLNQVRKRPYKWLIDSVWLNLNALAEIPQFKAILHQLDNNGSEWQSFYDSQEPENIKDLPDGYNPSPFHRLLLIRCWRVDRTNYAASDYIQSTLDERYVNSIPLKLEETFEETRPNIPVVCLLSQGADLSGDIEGLAEKKKIPISRISMGQGQAAAAGEYVKNGMANGGWVLLQNVHLGIDYLQVLEPLMLEMADKMEAGEVDESFRVWMTAEPTTKFPINLLQMSIKCTDDPPTGLKAGLMKSYTWITQQLLDKVDSDEWKQLLFTTCFLHSVLIERKKFGPLGWCVPYEFNSADLECSVLFLQRHMYEFEVKKLQWNTIKYMIGAVQYGGRITDDYDQRLLDTYCEKWISKKVFNNSFEFYRFDQHTYNVPLFQKIKEYRDHLLNDLPLFDPPEVFGLHSNAEITFNGRNAQSILGCILKIQPKSSSGSGGETRESVVNKLAEDYLERLPPEYNMIKVRKQLNKIDPLTIFLKQEIYRMNQVITKIRRTLEDLQLAIKGTIVMNTELQEALNYLYDAKVPPKWEKISWIAPTLGYWFSDVLARTIQFTNWVEEGRPKIFWLSGFFNPLAFLTAIKQEATRSHTGWSLETVSLKTEVTKKDKDNLVIPKDAEGVYIHGLFLDGAAWDRKAGKLVDSAPKILVNPLPVLHITPVNVVRNESTNTDYVCPVYRIPRRTALNYVFDIELKTDVDSSKWILRGVAALLSAQ